MGSFQFWCRCKAEEEEISRTRKSLKRCHLFSLVGLGEDILTLAIATRCWAFCCGWWCVCSPRRDMSATIPTSSYTGKGRKRDFVALRIRKNSPCWHVTWLFSIAIPISGGRKAGVDHSFRASEGDLSKTVLKINTGGRDCTVVRVSSCW